MTDYLQRETKEIVSYHLGLLHKYGLVQWSSGNISARCGCDDKIIIKPSGVPYHTGGLAWDEMIVVDMGGEALNYGKPSVDTPIHLGIYQRREDVQAIVHTHSTYATAFAVAGQNIPCMSTMAADVFGGLIPCSSMFLIDTKDIVKAVSIWTSHSQAMLLRGHGVFVVGESVTDAVKAAVLVEEVAKVAFLSRQLGWATSLPDDTVAALHKRYKESYGQ